MMKKDAETKNLKKMILPLAAGMMAVLALIVVLFVPKDTDKGNNSASVIGKNEAGASAQTTGNAAEINEEGNLVIYADRLSSEQISFIRTSENSRIELLARLGDDGTVRAALGTCQSCNGSPRAFYTQEGRELKCNNCGLTFPISVLDSPGGGCHPIMLNEEIMQFEGNNLVIDLEGLSGYEYLFSKIADH